MKIAFSFIIIVFLFCMSFSVDAATTEKKSSKSKQETSSVMAASSSTADSFRFTDNGDGTILDRDSGLVWLKDANATNLPMPWEGAKQYIHEMNSGIRPNFGHTDWRLPAINELQTLVDKSSLYPALPVDYPFTDVQNHFYWSSSKGTDVIDFVWILDMGSGEVTIDYRSACSYKFLWPVRSSWMPTKAVAGGVMTGGYNEFGQLGDGSTNSRNALLPVSGMEDVIKVAAGANHAIAIKSDGSLWAWGRNNRGQLGDGTFNDRKIPVAVKVNDRPVASGYFFWPNGSKNPVVVKDLWKVTDIAAGMYHSIALRADSTVWTWGRNSYGQLGDGSTKDSSVPIQVKGLSKVVAIAAGAYHSLAVTSDGSVWAWGLNAFGQLGEGSTEKRSEPEQVSNLSNVFKVAAGLHHSVAVKSDGSVWAWGWNIDGSLGNGTRKDSSTPVKVVGLSNIIDIAAGLHHTIALKKDGSVWSWGGNEYSQLGKAVERGSVPVQIEGIGNIKKVSAGMYHSLALMQDGTIWVWGKDQKDKAPKPKPVRLWDVSGITELSGGRYSTMVVSGFDNRSTQ